MFGAPDEARGAPEPRERPKPAAGPRSSLGESLFVSDLHLSPDRPATVHLFLDFLAGRARRAARLYILGDLFEAWIGDDDDSPPYPEIRAALRALTGAGTACSLIHGNRDFLIGRAFARDTGCTLLRDPTLIELDGQPVLLTHGDLLCTDDLAYQRFRRRVRNPLVTRLFLWKSLEARRQVAERYRQKSGLAMAGKTERIMDVNPGTVERYMQRFRANRLIHGHTHRPGEHDLLAGSRSVRRTVLAQWYETHGEVLVHAPGAWHREPVLPAGDRLG